MFNKILDNLTNRRQRILDGKYNCLPLPFPRFRAIFPGVEKSKYILLTANQKVKVYNLY